MKTKILLLALLPLFSLAQIKIKDLPTTTTGTTADYLLKDRSDGGSGATQKITIANTISTYSLVTNLTAGTGISLNKSGSTYTITNTGPLVDNYTYSRFLTTDYSTASTSTSNIVSGLYLSFGTGNTGNYSFEAHMLLGTTYTLGATIGIIKSNSDMTVDGTYQMNAFDTTAKTIRATRYLSSIGNSISSTNRILDAAGSTVYYSLDFYGGIQITDCPSGCGLYFILYTGKATNPGSVPITIYKGASWIANKEH